MRSLLTFQYDPTYLHLTSIKSSSVHYSTPAGGYSTTTVSKNKYDTRPVSAYRSDSVSQDRFFPHKGKSIHTVSPSTARKNEQFRPYVSGPSGVTTTNAMSPCGESIPSSESHPVDFTHHPSGRSTPSPPDLVFDTSVHTQLEPLVEPSAESDLLVMDDLSDDDEIGYPSDLEEDLPTDPTLDLDEDSDSVSFPLVSRKSFYESTLEKIDLDRLVVSPVVSESTPCDVLVLADPLRSIHFVFTALVGESRNKTDSVLVDPSPRQLSFGNLEGNVSSFGTCRRINVMLDNFASPLNIFAERGQNPIIDVSSYFSLFLAPLHLSLPTFLSTKTSDGLRGETGSGLFTLMVISGGTMSVDIVALSPSFSYAMIKVPRTNFLLDRLPQVEDSLGPCLAPCYFLPPWPNGPPSWPAPSDVLLQIAALPRRLLRAHSSVMSVFEWGRIDGDHPFISSLSPSPIVEDPPSIDADEDFRHVTFEDSDGRCRDNIHGARHRRDNNLEERHCRRTLRPRRSPKD